MEGQAERKLSNIEGIYERLRLGGESILGMYRAERE